MESEMKSELRPIVTAFYDLAYSPVSYDVAPWLIQARMVLAADGSNPHVHAVIVPKEDGVGGFAREWGRHDEAATRWRLWHIVIPMMQLAGATVTMAPTRRYAENMRRAGDGIWWPRGKAHFARPIVEAHKAGRPVPIMRASPAASRYVSDWLWNSRIDPSKLVTVTMRNQTTDADRNSKYDAHNLQEWLRARTYHTLFLDDSNEALKRGDGYAELDVDLRLALYEAASMNIIGNNGPSALMHFGTAPYLQFGVGLGKWKSHYSQHLGLETGEQWPWASPHQRMVYDVETMAVITREFKAWEERR
jgi:hypothetical protein